MKTEDWSDASISQGMAKTVSKTPETKEARKDPPQHFQKECSPADTLILDFKPPEM